MSFESGIDGTVWTSQIELFLRLVKVHKEETSLEKYTLDEKFFIQTNSNSLTYLRVFI